MKIFFIVIVISVLSLGTWYYFSDFRMQRILDSGRPVLLVNEKAGTYAFSDQVERSDLDEGFRIKGYLDKFTDDELSAIVKNLSYDGLIDESAFNDTAPIPEGIEAEKWNQALSALSQEQIKICDEQYTPTMAQYCLSRHLVFEAFQNNYGIEICDSIFIDAYREECIADIKNKAVHKVSDEINNNDLIDFFEDDLEFE